VEGLPWLAFPHADGGLGLAVHNAKLHAVQNRLGFVATLTWQLGASRASGQPTEEPRSRKLKEYSAVLDCSRLAKEDTLCHISLTEAERKWLRANRSPEAAHWNLLTDMKAENLDGRS
jgi:hypothetical protein